MGKVIFIHQLGAAFLMVTLTMWLQCTGIAALITWARGAVAGDIHKLGPLRSTVLVIRVMTAVIAVHGLQILLWASCYRWLCFPSWVGLVFFGKQLRDRRLWRYRPPIDVAYVGPGGEHHRGVDVRIIGKPSVCGRYAAPRPPGVIVG
jgi:hypothetical protein